jgi:glycosyltransferase involved in cell wall biosynthesis
VLRFEKVATEERTVHPLVRHGVALFGSPPREPWALDVSATSERAGRLFPEKPAGTLRVAFLSRIVPKKNLFGALEIVKTLEGRVSITIYGPAEDDSYWRRCQDLISEMPPGIIATHAGEIPHERVAEVLRLNDVFLFPTLGENFGHVICEALQAGCPPVISDQTPWRNLASHGAGWDLPIEDTETFRRVLQECVDMEANEYQMFRQRVARYGGEVSRDPAILDQNRSMLNLAVSRFQRPSAQ